MSSRPGRRTQLRERRPAIADQADEDIREGRALKYRAARTRDAEARADLFAQAAARYLAAARGDANSTYALINAASLSAMAGDRAQAAALADEVLALLDNRAHAPDTPYWLAATRAEAELVKGDADRARSSLKQAVALAPRAWEDHAIALRQFRLLLGETGEPTEWLDRFTPPAVMVFGGTMGLAPGEEIASALLADAVDDFAPCEGHGALAAGTDILVAEALLARGCDLHVVLPAGPELFRQVSVVAVDPAWGPRFDACLARAASLEVISDTGLLDQTSSALAARIAMGRVIGRAKDLETRPRGLRAIVHGGGNPGISLAWEAWDATGHECRTIELERTAQFAGFVHDAQSPLHVLVAVAGSDSAIEYPDIADALAAARRHAGAPVGIDVQAGVGISADFAIAAARAGGEPGLWMGSTALAVARLADPAIDAELAGAVRHAGGTGDLYRVRTG